MGTDTSERILLVDDEQELLDGMRRIHRKQYKLHTANSGPAGLSTLSQEGPFAIVVSDYQMPGMDGVTFLGKVSKLAPDTVRVMLTGKADLTTAIEAVNQGSIFRFLTKPCSPESFVQGIEAALEQYGLRQAERVLLEQTLRRSVEVMADILSLSNPAAFGRSFRVRNYVKQLVETLGYTDTWIYETAALLSQIGFVAIPPDIIEKLAADAGSGNTYEEVMARHPAVAKELLGKIPRLEKIAEIIANQRLRYCDAEKAGMDATILRGSQVLSAALDFDELVTLGARRKDAIGALAARPGCYAPKVLEALEQINLPGARSVERSLKVDELRIGMILDQDVVSLNGAKVVPGGHVISQSLLARLRSYKELQGIVEPIRVHIPNDKAARVQDEA